MYALFFDRNEVGAEEPGALSPADELGVAEALDCKAVLREVEQSAAGRRARGNLLGL
jgi:hypothetical protein